MYTKQCPCKRAGVFCSVQCPVCRSSESPNRSPLSSLTVQDVPSSSPLPNQYIVFDLIPVYFSFFSYSLYSFEEKLQGKYCSRGYQQILSWFSRWTKIEYLFDQSTKSFALAKLVHEVFMVRIFCREWCMLLLHFVQDPIVPLTSNRTGLALYRFSLCVSHV